MVLVVFVKSDVSELKLNDTETHKHEDSHEHPEPAQEQPESQQQLHAPQHTLKELQDIKFSLQIILRELKYLTSHPVFTSIKDSAAHDHQNYEATNTAVQEVMKQVEAKIEELESVPSLQDYQTKPELQLSTPFEHSRASLPSVSTVLDNFWLNDDYTAHDASQRILVAIGPVLRKSEYHERHKRDIRDFQLFDPFLINQELDGAPKPILRREIDTREPYYYNRPEINFEGSSSGTKETEYLPPLETSAANVNTVKQVFSKDTGYEYKKPDKPFLLPGESKNWNLL